MREYKHEKTIVLKYLIDNFEEIISNGRSVQYLIDLFMNKDNPENPLSECERIISDQTFRSWIKEFQNEHGFNFSSNKNIRSVKQPILNYATPLDEYQHIAKQLSVAREKLLKEVKKFIEECYQLNNLNFAYDSTNYIEDCNKSVFNGVFRIQLN